MKTSSLKLSVLGVMFAATGALMNLVADPLLPSGAVYVEPTINAMSPGTLSAGTVLASDLDTLTIAGVDFKVGVTVLSGVSSPLSGLTFVYEILNDSALPSTGDPVIRGITEFRLDGWAGIDMDVVTGDEFFHSSGGTGVQQGFINRSPDGNEVLFEFPPGTSEPPIFAGEKSWQLIVYTNATAFTVGNSWINGWDFDTIEGGWTDGTDWYSPAFSTFVAAGSVPDAGSTALLLGIGFISMAFSLARMRKSAARK